VYYEITPSKLASKKLLVNFKKEKYLVFRSSLILSVFLGFAFDWTEALKE